MTTEVKKLTPEERKEATAKLREKHQPIFDALEIPTAKFIPKMAHYQAGLSGLHMGFFESELVDKSGNAFDTYTEKVSRIMESEDPDRTLFKHKANPHYKEEYAASEPNRNGDVRYFVPVSELIEVKAPEKSVKKASPKKKTISTVSTLPGDEAGVSELTARDHACIHLRVANSSKEWLNELINEANPIK